MLIACVAALAGLSLFKFGTAPDLSQLRPLMLENWQNYLLPEPVERAAFVAAVLSAVPIILVCAMTVVRQAQPPEYKKLLLLLPVAAFIAVIPTTRSTFLPDILFNDPKTYIGGSVWAQCGAYILFSALIAVILFAAFDKLFISSKAARIAILLVSAVLALFIGVIRVRSAAMIYNDIHFEAVFYSISQVAAGRTILVDLPAQYGLYAELLGPVISRTGVTVLGFTIFLSALQIIAVTALIMFAAKTIRTPLILALAILTLLFFIGNTWMLLWRNPIRVEYFQVWPIRLFFPAILVACFALFYRQRMGHGPMLCLSAIAGIGLIWNFDWGIPALGGIVLYALLQCLFGRPVQRNLINLTIVILVPILICMVFAVYLTIKGDNHVNWAMLLKYQSIFYGFGFGMLPVPRRPDPWMIVFGLYIYGLVVGIIAQVCRRPNLTSDSVLLLSVLGLGIFAYYQGRSHEVVLSFVLWPAALIAFILADNAVRAVKLKVLPKTMLLATVPTFVFGLTASTALILGIPRLATIGMTMLSTAFTVDSSSKAHANIAFVLGKADDGGPTVILAQGQAALYAETGLGSAISGPGIAEMLLKEDRDNLIRGLLANKVRHVFLDQKNQNITDGPFALLMEKYELADTSPTGILYLQPKQYQLQN